jgi:flagellar M-ring protein FliF
MDVVSRAYSQLADLYRSMTPGSRLTAGLLAAVVLLSVGYLATHQVSTPDVDLMHGVPVEAGQLPIMEAAFHKANLQGYVIRGASIFVPHGQEPAYMAALADAKALPQRFGDALREAISAGNAFENSRQRDQRIKIATQDTLAQFICAMPGIERAYVLCDVDNKPGFNRDKLITATASVKPAGSAQLDEARVSAIRYLVAPAFAGLKAENVTVTDLNGGRTWHGDIESSGADGHRYLSLQRTYEQDLKAKILNALCFIPNVTVDVTVELSIARATERPSSNATGGRTRRANRPATPVQPSNTAMILSSLLGGRGQDATAEQDAADQDGHEQSAKEGPDFAPTLARVSVGVPIAYFKSIWQKRNSSDEGKPSPAPSPSALDQIRTEESAKIQRHVAQLLPSVESVAKAGELVTVTTFEDLPGAEPPSPLLSEKVLIWVRQSWATLATIALGLASLLVLRSMVRHGSLAAEVPAESHSINDEESESIGRASTAVPPPHAQRFYEAGASSHNELSKLVEDDPESAANVLRTWIGHVD